MKLLTSIALLLALSSTAALAKDKKKAVLPAVFSNARYVYVQAEDGDALNPNLFPEDREAISNVLDALQDWKRYVVTLHRNEADLVMVVRKGRQVSAQVRGDIGNQAQIGPRHNAGASLGDPGQDGASDRTNAARGIDVRGDVGPADDLLRVYMLTPDGKLSGPLWERMMKDGLDAPDLLLFKGLKDAVEHDYPAKPVAQAATPAKP